MAKSRRRTRGTTSRQRRRQNLKKAQRMRSSRNEAITLEARHPARHLSEILTHEDLRHFQLCMEAEARGDLETALDHYLASPSLEGSPQLHDLLDLRALGDDVPPWAWSRWICRQAHRWLIFEQDPRIRDAVLYTLASMYTDLDVLALDDPNELFEIGTALAVAHWVTAQLLLHDFGGLSDFIDCRATPELLTRADPMDPWVASSLGGYLIIDLHDAVIELVDLADWSRFDVLNIGAVTGLARGQVVIGRVVPISTAPGLMFESRPLEVDERTAIGVARAEGLEWLAWLNDAVVSGRLPEGYGAAAVTPTLCDVVPEPARGMDVAQALGTCELALVVADVAPEALGACAPDAARRLIHDVVFEAAREHCTSPDRELAWRRLARAMAEPMRSRCERLADACRQTPGLDPAA